MVKGEYIYLYDLFCGTKNGIRFSTCQASVLSLCYTISSETLKEENSQVDGTHLDFQNTGN